MTGHTPGPWLVSVGRAGRIGVYSTEKDHAGALVAYCETTPQTTAEQRDANASLIAAAPDLLAELRNIAEADTSTWDATVRDQFREWAQNRARAAVAKGKGR